MPHIGKFSMKNNIKKILQQKRWYLYNIDMKLAWTNKNFIECTIENYRKKENDKNS